MPNLVEYRHKRHFQKTPEPSGQRAKTAPSSSFVIQKHDASHLHYDFRLEAEGVLKSWAVPKGPSTDPQVKRLAIQVEDHPLNYATFEGVIPKGQYGGGNVIVWDRGTYRNTTQHNGQPVPFLEGLRQGHISIWLDGEKLRGGYTLSRTHYPGRKAQWLLVKVNDSEAHHPEDPVLTLPASVMSGRTVNNVQFKAPIRKTTEKSKMPSWIEPMLATLADNPFDRAGWIYEPKLDGERCMAYKQGKQVLLFSRHQKSLNAIYPEIVHALERQTAQSIILDGEIVTFEPGTKITSFKRLQQRMHLKDAKEISRSKIPVSYHLFDILYLNGQDLRKKSLVQRKSTLKDSITLGQNLQINPFIEENGAAYYHQACRNKWEGVIAKRIDGPYLSGRSRDWLKFKCTGEQEFVIGGYTDPQGSRGEFGALLIGYYDAKNNLTFAGKVGTGFDEKSLRLLKTKMTAHEQKTSPFTSVNLPRRGLHWLSPQLVAQIGFSEWTDDGKLRHPRYLGLRDDKTARDVVRETPVSSPEMVKAYEERNSTKISKGGNSAEVTIEAKPLKLSNLNKVFYPATGFTKGQILDYYARVAPVLLAHLHHRPVTLKRYPDGVEGLFFYEKQAPSYKPAWLKTYAINGDTPRSKTDYCLVNDVASLMWIANLGTLELHSLLSRAPQVDRPTLVAFDLDPGEAADLSDCASAALALRVILEKVKLQSFLKTSGSKGLHLYIPLNTETTYDATQSFAHAVALVLEQQNPKRIVSNMRKELRKGKVLVDWSQNSRHKTTVSAYSLRAQSIPSVSTPISWEELENAVRKADFSHIQFTSDQVLQRIRKRGDLFAAVQTLKQKLPHFKP